MNKHMGKIRGLAIEPRGVGKTDLFNTEDFSLSTLRKLPRQSTTMGKVHKEIEGSCCRYPCPICRKIMPLFDIPAGPGLPAPYDIDMDAANVNPS
jgi:hypothetical protein